MAKAKLAETYDVVWPDGTRKRIAVAGRIAWALGHLAKAGESGCTPIDTPGPRWSHYVYKLRRDYNIPIETIDEPHGGTFAGSHARYVLNAKAELVERTEQRAAA